MKLSRKEAGDLQAKLNEQLPTSARAIVISEEAEGTCQLCGKTAETRPYGPNREEICYDCGKKDEVLTIIRLNEQQFGVTLTREQAEKMVQLTKAVGPIVDRLLRPE